MKVNSENKIKQSQGAQRVGSGGGGDHGQPMKGKKKVLKDLKQIVGW